MRATCLLAALLLLGCATAPPPTYDELSASARAGREVDVGELREAFIAAPDFAARMQRLGPLERQAMRIIEEEPLRLGPIGTAILDEYQGSLAGHHALANFYAHLDSEDSASEHRDWVSRIRANLEGNHDGTKNYPYPVLSAPEANAYLVVSGSTPVGSMYHTTANVPFMMMVAAKPDEGRLANVYFDLEAAYVAVRETVARSAPEKFNPGALIGLLAQRDDTAAQAFIGTYLASEDRLDEAVQWLSASSRTGNVLANLMLARVYYSKARRLEEGASRDEAMEFVMQNYLHAIAVGSDEAMYTLGALYLNEHYGQDNVSSGLPLLKQATGFDNTDAMIHLAQLYYRGHRVDQNYDTSEEYFVHAASLDDKAAKLQYGRFLMDAEVEKDFNKQAYEWLRALAKDNTPCADIEGPCPAAEAKLILGNLYATGTLVNQNYRRALSWFKSAVAASPDDPSIVNEVAWTLTVTNLERLRDERYALRIMDSVMTADETARQTAAYLDTWAAAYAASGNFDRAVVLQRKALEEATEQEQTDVLEVLEDHLKLFQAGETITETVP